jgi:hypothetical protein
MDLKPVFENARWGNSKETRSGPGSTLEGCRELRAALPVILAKFGVRKLNDAGCGDLNWMSGLDLGGVEYRGFDLHGLSGPEAARLGRMKAGPRSVSWLDIVHEAMPPADLILCRDVFIHLPNEMVMAAIQLFRESAPLLLSTSTRGVDNSKRTLAPGQFQPINLEGHPFSLGKPVETVEEPQWGRYLGLWGL